MSYSDQHTNKEGDFFFGSFAPTLQVASFDALTEVANKLEAMQVAEKVADDKLCSVITSFSNLKSIRFVVADRFVVSKRADTDKRFRNYGFITTQLNENLSFSISDTGGAGERFFLNNSPYSLEITFQAFSHVLLVHLMGGLSARRYHDQGALRHICRDAWSVLSAFRKHVI